MAVYWHIAWSGYKAGQPLLCRQRLGDEAPPWKWSEDAPEGFDGDVVCLFPDTPRGRTEANWLWFDHQDYHLLRIEVPDGTEVGYVEEGYPAIRGVVPAEWITLVRTGYAKEAVRRPGDEY